LNVTRSTNLYRAAEKDDQELRTRMKELANRYKRYGSPRIHVLLKREGLVINHKRTERIYREEGLSIRRKKKLKVSFRVTLSPA